MFGVLNLGDIKVGQIFVLSKNRSWVLVDACNFFQGGHSLGHVQEALEMFLGV